MNKNTTILIFLALALNSSYGSPIVKIGSNLYTVDSLKVQTQKNNKILDVLKNKGLDKNTINNIEEAVPKNYYSMVNESINEIKNVIPEVEVAKLTSYVANKNMQGNFPLFDKYSEKIGLLQNTYKIALSDCELKSLSRIS